MNGKDPSKLGFKEFWDVVKHTEQPKFSDIINENVLYNGNIQIIKNIPVYINNEFENDNIGPAISLSQEESVINNGSIQIHFLLLSVF